MKVLVWLLAGACACTGSSSQHKIDKAPPVTADARAGSANVNKKSDGGAAAAFVRGPSTSPGAALITWLDQQVVNGEARLVRLPIVLGKDGPGFSLRGARIGTGGDAVAVYANDSALGVGLADRARTKCKDQPTCAFTCEGYWRGKQGGDYTFDVTKAEPVDGGAVPSYAEVEGESGN